MAKKNGRKKIRKIKSGKIWPEKISGNFWPENLPANLFENKNQETESQDQAGLTPEEYIGLFRRAYAMARKNGQKSHWAYMGLLVQDSLEQRARQAERPGGQGAVAQKARAHTHARPQSRQEAAPRTASRERTAPGRRGSARGKAAKPPGSRAAGRTKRPRNRT